MTQAGIILHVGLAGGLDDRAVLEGHGHQVVTCAGRGPERCLLVEDGWCPMVDRADGVLLSLDLDDPYHRAVLRCYREELGDASPLAVVVPVGQEAGHAALLTGLDVSGGTLECPERFSSQVEMAAAARGVVGAAGDLTRSSARRFAAARAGA